MSNFNFHHHFATDFGIYNLNYGEKAPDFPFSAGIHPKDISADFDSQFSWLMKISEDKNCVAIGECGLDKLVEANLNRQKEVFVKQIHLANDLQKPIVIHCVRQFHELPNFKKIASVPLIIHGFNKRETIGNELLGKGFYFSFGKSLLQNVDLQLFFKNISLDKLFLETDAAEINIDLIYQKAAEIKNLSIEKLNDIIKENLKKIGVNI